VGLTETTNVRSSTRTVDTAYEKSTPALTDRSKNKKVSSGGAVSSQTSAEDRALLVPLEETVLFK